MENDQRRAKLLDQPQLDPPLAPNKMDGNAIYIYNIIYNIGKYAICRPFGEMPV